MNIFKGSSTPPENLLGSFQEIRCLHSDKTSQAVLQNIFDSSTTRNIIESRLLIGFML
jgi:hypothetical protein